MADEYSSKLHDALSVRTYLVLARGNEYAFLLPLYRTALCRTELFMASADEPVVAEVARRQ